MPHPPSPDAGLRLAEVMAALSLATDLGMGQPLEFALRSCVLAVRLGEALGLSDQDLRSVYYQALLRYIGCNAETDAMAALFGDELALRAEIAPVDQGRTVEVIGVALRFLRQANAGAPLLRLAQAVAHGLLTMPQTMRDSFTGHCEVAQRLAGRIGFPEDIRRGLGQLYERWDGRGLPGGLKGEQIAVAVRVAALAQDAVLFHRAGGVEAAVEMARQRAGGAHDPHIAERFCREAGRLTAGLDAEPTWDTVLTLEPGERIRLTEAQFDEVCQAIADFADIKSPYTLGHSSGVAALAAAAAQRGGLPGADAVALHRAGLLHDIGRVGVSAGVWGKAGALSDREWERVRLHPYYTERVLSRSGALARLGALAAGHHERLDGSGYHRGAPGVLLTPAARLLAAADAFHAMLEQRPHRAALDRDAAAAALHSEVRAGRLDGDAVAAVLAATGVRAPGRRRTLAAGLSEREIEVLRLIARGRATKEIAGLLAISPKTADHHIQHIYSKIGVSTRAGATLFAMEHDLLAPAE